MPGKRTYWGLGMDDAQRFFRRKDAPMRQALFLHLLLDVCRGIGAAVLQAGFQPEAGFEKRLWAWPFASAGHHIFIDPCDRAPLELSPALAKDLGPSHVACIAFGLHEQDLGRIAGVFLDKEPQASTTDKGL